MTAGNVTIREETQADQDGVAAVHRSAFSNHGEAVVSLVEDLRALLAPGVSLVATVQERVVGHALFTRQLLDAPQRLVEVQVLSPLGVLPEWQRQAIGSALVREGIQQIAHRNVPLIFLEGDPRYYSRFGFTPALELGFRKPSLRIPDAGFQVLALASYEPWMTGTLVYCDAFWRHDLVGLR